MSLADCAEVRVGVAMRPPSGNLVICAHVSKGSSHLLLLATECGNSALPLLHSGSAPHTRHAADAAELYLALHAAQSDLPLGQL